MSFYYLSSLLESNIHDYGVSLGNPSLCLYALYSVLHRTPSLSLVSSPSCFHHLSPPSFISFAFVLIFCQAVEGLLSQADALSASGQDTGPGTVVSADHTPAATALIRQDRSILGEEKEDRELQQVLLSHNQDKALFVDSLVEVKEYYEFGSSDRIVNVKGKLRENVSFYQSIGVPDFALNVIRNGYILPFVNFPDSVILPDNRSARDYSSFVNEALLELLSSGRIIQVVAAPFVVNPLFVSVQPSGKKKLILDT